jgi:hypothetical protein
MSAEAVLVDDAAEVVGDGPFAAQEDEAQRARQIQTKVKYRKVTDVGQLGLKTKTYEVADAEVTGDGKRSKVDVQRSVRTDSLDPVDPRALIDAITDVYRSLKPAKEARA